MLEYENILNEYKFQINNFQKDYLESIFNINKNYKNNIGYLINLKIQIIFFNLKTLINK